MEAATDRFISIKSKIWNNFIMKQENGDKVKDESKNGSEKRAVEEADHSDDESPGIKWKLKEIEESWIIDNLDFYLMLILY